MTDKLNSSNVPRLGVQSDVESIPLDEYFQTLKNKINEYIDEINAIQIGTTNAETTAARPYHTSLKNRLDSIRNGQFPYLKTGGVVTVNGGDPQKFDVTAGEASIAGIDIKWAATTSSTVAYTSANTRFDFIVINSDSSVSIVTGSESADPVYPTISDTQKAIARLTVGTASITIIDCRNWGAYYIDAGIFKYKFDLNSAISDASSGTLISMRGTYYDRLSISYKSLYVDGRGLILYRKSDSNSCIQIDSCDNVTVEGVQAYGNGKAGNKSLFELIYTDEVTIKNCYGDGNSLSTIDGKDITVENSNDLIMLGNRFSSIDTSITTFNNQMREIKVSKIEPESDVDILGFNVVGEKNTIATVGLPAITALSPSRVAFIDDVNEDLRTYDFDGTNWSQVGNDLNISGTGFPAITALSPSRVAFIDRDNDDLRTYDFDGTNWSQVGNDLNISGVGAPALSALSSSRVAFIDFTNADLRTYDFDGTNWAQVGNDLNISGTGAPAITALSSTRIAFIDFTINELRTYYFDGTNWSQVGNGLSISGVNNPALSALSSSRVAFIDNANDDLRTYYFDGTNWSQVGNDLNISGTGVPALSALSSSRVAFIDNANDELTTYEIDYNLSQSAISPSLGTI